MLQNKSFMQNWFWALLMLFSIKCNAQALDTISNVNTNIQEYKINENLIYQYQKPRLFDFITRIPHDFGLMGDLFVQKNNLIFFGATLAGTAALIPVDQKIIDGSRNFGNTIGFDSQHSYSGPIKMFPKNINSSIYRIGNGFSAVLIGSGLLAYGAIKNNYRAMHTSSEILEGLIASGLLVQPLKRITGRESPFIAEQNGNSGSDWELFPSFSGYQKRTPYYDAMPSGHLTTLVTTFMIISGNYKDVKWIRPVGYGVTGLMGFEMLQSKVHWASDYPIAVFMGYIIGKSIVKSRIAEKNTAIGDVRNFKPKFHYSFSSNQSHTLVGAAITF